jgi:hypothetical protein
LSGGEAADEQRDVLALLLGHRRVEHVVDPLLAVVLDADALALGLRVEGELLLELVDALLGLLAEDGEVLLRSGGRRLIHVVASSSFRSRSHAYGHGAAVR